MQKFPLKKGLSDVNELHDEINEYINVLMGHINPQYPMVLILFLKLVVPILQELKKSKLNY